MYFLYSRLDINALWFKLETSKSLSFEPTRLIGLVSLGDFNDTKTNSCFILHHPQHSHTLTQLSILFSRLGTHSLDTFLGSFQPARSSPSSDIAFITRTILATSYHNSSLIHVLATILPTSATSQIIPLILLVCLNTFATFRDRVFSIILNSCLVLASSQHQSPTNQPLV